MLFKFVMFRVCTFSWNWLSMPFLFASYGLTKYHWQQRLWVRLIPSHRQCHILKYTFIL